MECLLDFLTAAKPSRGAAGFVSCPTCGKEMATALFETHRKVSHR
jgi:4-hydroxy-3-methylbut-2-en-1-yl diphosphate synthase IspG/GcpE